MEKILKTDGIPHLYNATKWFALICGVLFLLARLNGHYSIPDYLWAEDGRIFINQAIQFNLKSLFTPYAGYLHTYQRLIGLVANWFSLSYVPYIYFFGWFLIFILTIQIITNSALKNGMSTLSVIFLGALITLIPNHGELFFTLTNVQWFIGVALTIYLLDPLKEKPNLPKLFCITVGCLTGPFSIFIMPILLLQGIYLKQLSKNYLLYFIVLSCSLIQICFVIQSHRVTSISTDTSYLNWLVSVFRFLTFNVNTTAAYIAVAFFWLEFIALLTFSSIKKSLDTNKILFYVFTAFIMFAAGLYVTHPLNGSPLGCRYTFIPWVLLFYSALLLAKSSKLCQITFLITLGSICFSEFTPVKRTPLQFPAFAEFSKYKDVNIPINPQWSQFPGWSIDSSYSKNKDPKFLQKQYSITNPSFHFESIGNIPSLTLNEKIVCPASRYVGVEISLWRDKADWLQLFWSGNKSFDKNKSIKRFYPEGEIIAQFAFPNSTKGLFLRFEAMNQPGNAKINNIHVYCIPVKNNA